LFRAKLAPLPASPSTLDHKQLGPTDTRLPEVGLGAWQYSGGIGPLRHAIERGAFFIDIAESQL
jgi:aryl-alcohol dehydrogenase-like predicted oxidoreductase